MSQLKTNFGNRVRTLRLDADMTQEEMANRIDVTVETISNIERGVYGAKFDTLENLAEILGVPVKELFDFNE